MEEVNKRVYNMKITSVETGGINFDVRSGT